MDDFQQNAPGLVSKVRERMDWRMKFPAHDAPPAPPPHDPELDARLLDAAIDHDAAVAMEDGTTRTPEGIPLYPSYSQEYKRPFVAANTGTLYN